MCESYHDVKLIQCYHYIYILYIYISIYIYILQFCLLNRTITTRVGSAYSTSLDLKSGIVQGSCIGPLLFIIYINDIADLFNGNVKCSLYADDLRLHSVVDSQDDFFVLQSAIDELVSKNATQNILHNMHDYSRIGLRVTDMHSHNIVQYR